MFDNLKSKLKGLFKKAPAEVAEPEAPKEEPQISQPVETPQMGAPRTEAPESGSAPVQPAAQPEVKPAVAPAPEVPKEEPQLSRKEQIKLAREEKKRAKAEAKAEKAEAKAAAKAERTETKEQVAPKVGEDAGLFAKKIKEDSLDEMLWELEVALMEADVALPVAEEIKQGVKDNLLGKKFSRGHTLEEVVELSLKDAVHNVLKLNEFDFDQWFLERQRPVSIMFVGINGTGKTTAIAKIANRLQKQGFTVVMAAGDTFRAGAIEQLTIHADRLGCKIIKHNQDADPAAVAYDAIEHAKAKRRDCVLIDTAGRMQTNSNLIDEMKKIVRVAKPDLKVFVGDSLAGNDAVEQAKAFDEAIGVDAVILTKIDADSKGGAALSIAHTIGKPIAFVCNGQEYDDIIKFDSQWMLNRLFDD